MKLDSYTLEELLLLRQCRNCLKLFLEDEGTDFIVGEGVSVPSRWNCWGCLGLSE
jgi:hypothetical protein